jgi:hypothetical protein
MPARTRRTGTPHNNFMRAVQDELTKFEQSERKFREQNRDEPAKRLQMPVEKYGDPDGIVRKPSNLMCRANDASSWNRHQSNSCGPELHPDGVLF